MTIRSKIIGLNRNPNEASDPDASADDFNGTTEVESGTEYIADSESQLSQE